MVFYVATKILPKKGLSIIILEPVWKNTNRMTSHVEISYTGGYFRAVSGTQLSYGNRGGPLEGHLYRYNNYDEKEWVEVGTTLWLCIKRCERR